MCQSECEIHLTHEFTILNPLKSLKSLTIPLISLSNNILTFVKMLHNCYTFLSVSLTKTLFYSTLADNSRVPSAPPDDHDGQRMKRALKTKARFCFLKEGNEPDPRSGRPLLG